LEVIAEDTYFTPYKTEYLTEVSRKVEVISVNGKSKESLTESESVDITDSKPKVTISDIKNDDALLIKEHVNRINKNITRSNLNIFKKEDKTKVIKTIQNYLTENKVENSLYNKIMTELYTLLSDDLS
jgi:predicted HNH restriction endonuclease